MQRFSYLLTFLGLTFLSATARLDAGVAVIGSLSRQSKLEPGATFDGVIFLKNTGGSPGEARVFQTDYTFAADGSSTYGEPASHPRSNASWITVTPTRVKLPPGETVPVRYKGKAPADSKLRGTYWSMIIIEPLTEAPQLPEATKDKVAIGFQTKIRTGIQIVTELGKGGTSQLQIKDKSLAKADGKRVLQLDLYNSGERMLVPGSTVELFDATGASIGRFDGGRGRIYPTCSLRAKIDLTDVPPGKYSAMVLLDAGGDQVMGAQYDLQIDP